MNDITLEVQDAVSHFRHFVAEAERARQVEGFVRGDELHRVARTTEAVDRLMAIAHIHLLRLLLIYDCLGDGIGILRFVERIRS